MADVTVEILRPADLLVATVTLHNLQLRGSKLVRDLTGQPVGISVELPPQHFRERVGFETLESRGTVTVGAPTRLELNLRTDAATLELGPDGLWGLCEQLGVSQATALTVPARCELMPAGAQWTLGVRPRVLDGGTELWRARLAPPAPGAPARNQLVIRAVHMARQPTWPVLPTQEQLRDRYRGGVLEATRFDLSPLGASVRMGGPVSYDDQIADPAAHVSDLNTYRHDIDFGRDSYVSVVTPGHLSSGHAAKLIEVSRLEFIAGPAPILGSAPQRSSTVLNLTRMIVVDDPVFDVGAAAAAYGGLHRDMPFRTLRLVRTRTTIDRGTGGGTAPFWPRQGGQDVRFAMEGVDWSGRVVGFDLALMFIPLGSSPNAVAREFGGPGQAERQTAPLGGAPVTLADPSPRPEAATTLAVDDLLFTVRPSIAGTLAAPLVPMVSSVGLVLEAVTQVTGVQRAVRATWHDAYRQSGLAQAGNKLAAFLRLPAETPLPMDPRKAGGLVKPDMVIGAITGIKGAVPAGFELGSRPDPATILRQFGTARILGLIPLTQVVDLVGMDVPELRTSVTPQEVRVTYHWQAPIKDNTTLLKPHGPKPKLEVTATTTRRTGDGQTTATITGVLTDTAIEFAGVVRLSFESLTFTADPGRKPDIRPKGMKLEFFNELAFLNDLREVLEKAGLAKGASVDVTPDRVTAGFSAALPSTTCGVFAIANLAISTELVVPFTGDPVRFSFGLAERFKPFTLSYSAFTGGGFFVLQLDSGGIRRVEAALEFGGSLSLDLVVATGGVYVMAGIYFTYLDHHVTISGYLRAGGHLSVLGIITVSVDFYMQLSYDKDTKRVSGRASLTVGIKVLFISKSVTLSVERSFVGSAVDPSFTDCYELGDWREYCRAFA